MRSGALPRCEACGREPASSFSWFADRARWYEPRSGVWRFTGACTTETENYYAMVHHRGQGFLDSAKARADWLRHLGEKTWFDAADFVAMLRRFAAAPRSQRVKSHRRARLRMNVKEPAGRLRAGRP
jgi:hypothetical protein